MKKLILILLVITIQSCSTSQVTKNVNAQYQNIEETVREDKIIGDSLPSWVKKSGIENGIVYTVGQAEFSANKSPLYVEKAAIMDAEIKLISDAPADVRVLTQNALNGANIDSSEFYQIQTKLQEVVGLSGVKVDQEKVTCRKIIRYGEMSAKVVRSCWVQAHISLSNLSKAYERTLALKFGNYKADQFRKLMQKEIERINNNPLQHRERQDEKANITDVVSDNNSQRVRLSSIAKK